MLSSIHLITQAAIASGEPMTTALIALNNAHEVELSRLDELRFQSLVAQSFVSLRVGEAEAFLISFDQSAPIDGVNFRWFRDQMDRFVYVDRVVVDEAFRGRGHARRLYQTLVEAVRAAGCDRVVCEVNSRPPNLASDRFHAGLGFQVVGGADLAGGQKAVRYLMSLV